MRTLIKTLEQEDHSYITQETQDLATNVRPHLRVDKAKDACISGMAHTNHFQQE